MKRLIKFLFLLGVGALVGAGIFVYTLYQTAFVPLDETSDSTARLTIEPGMTAQRVVDQLAELELIQHPTLANFMVRFKGWGQIQAGEYELSPTLTLEEMFQLFESGAVVAAEASHRVTVPEGETLAFVLTLLAPITGLTSEELAEAWRDEAFLLELINEYWFLTEDILKDGIKHPLEGYIYPLTYDFMGELYTPEQLARQLLDVTARVLEPVRELMMESSMTIHEIFSLASIVEGETPNRDEMPAISGVFHNRLEIGMRLQSCATIQYILEERVTHVTGAMTRIESPFNTYLNAGLPIGPVNSPSIDAIRATLQPTSHDYLFFIGDIFHCVDGRTHFFTNYGDHSAFANKHLQPSYRAGENVCL